VNRVLNMTGRFAGGAVPLAGADGDADKELKELWASTAREYLALFAQFQFHTALDRLFAFIRSINGFIEKRAPWKLGKSQEPADAALLATSLATMAEALRLASAALRPVMPASTAKIDASLSCAPAGTWLQELEWGSRLTGGRTSASLVLFPRPQPPAAAAK
jgi:methionyl-tRNA synthetase